ncbi:MAG: hypothetical protein AAFX76_07465 [Planctomycetota bacterium]
MARLTAELNHHQLAYVPGEPIEGLAGWELDGPPKWVEARLYWHTAGKGDEDVVVVDTVRYDDPPAVDAQPFRFTAPQGPFSYAGRLLEIAWGVEVVAHRVKGTAHVDLTLSATGHPIRPPKPTSEATG